VQQESNASNGITNLCLMFFFGTDLMFEPYKVSFILSTYTKCSNDRFWSCDNPHAVHLLPLHSLTVRVWYPISAWRTKIGRTHLP